MNKSSHRGFGGMSELLLGCNVKLVGSEIIEYGNKKYTRLIFHGEKGIDEVLEYKIVPVFDFDKVYLNNSGLSLLSRVKSKEITIQDAMRMITEFKIVNVENTGEYPIKLSVAAQTIGLPTNSQHYTSANWRELHTVYAESKSMRKLRTDLKKDESWKEIRTVHIKTNNK